uniref:Uncharacterized protein n=1 Tax=Arundo donax TaxID=35708 RepID=A0A0A9CYX1_ARUDO
MTHQPKPKTRFGEEDSGPKRSYQRGQERASKANTRLPLTRMGRKRQSAQLSCANNTPKTSKGMEEANGTQKLSGGDETRGGSPLDFQNEGGQGEASRKKLPPLLLRLTPLSFH